MYPISASHLSECFLYELLSLLFKVSKCAGHKHSDFAFLSLQSFLLVDVLISTFFHISIKLTVHLR